jgi:hypothetical protein
MKIDGTMPRCLKKGCLEYLRIGRANCQVIVRCVEHFRLAVHFGYEPDRDTFDLKDLLLDQAGSPLESQSVSERLVDAFASKRRLKTIPPFNRGQDDFFNTKDVAEK